MASNTHTHTDTLWLKEKRLHPDKSEVIVQRQALVGDIMEVFPHEGQKAALRRRPVNRLRTKVLGHEEIGHLMVDKTKKREQN